MPPSIPRKRIRSSSPEPSPAAATASKKETRILPSAPATSEKKKGTKILPPVPPRKKTVFDELDDRGGSAEKTKKFLEKLRAKNGDDEDSELSELSSDEVEAIAPPSSKRVKTENDRKATTSKSAPSKGTKEKKEKPEKKSKSKSKSTSKSKPKEKAKPEVKSTISPPPPPSRIPPPRKKTVFDELDAQPGDPGRVKRFLERLAERRKGENSDLSSTDSDEEFEDVVSNEFAGKHTQVEKPAKSGSEEESGDEDGEEMEFEDVEPSATRAPLDPQAHAISGPSVYRPRPGANDEESDGDLDLTLIRDTRIPLVNTTGTKKGPSKIERAIRVSTHQMHVQFLLWHNAIRNGWCSDKAVQEVLVKQCLRAKGMDKILERWKRDSGLLKEDESKPKELMGPPPKPVKDKGKTKANGKGKEAEADQERNQRDWSSPAKRATPGKVNMSKGDPLISFLTKLSGWWRQKFIITAPGLHKVGYMTLQRIDDEIKSWRVEPEVKKHGERIPDRAAWKKLAEEMEGSRDVGAQLFASLLRRLGFECRIVVSLQPVGFGWSKNEDAAELKERKEKPKEDVTPETDTDNSDAATPAARRTSIARFKSVTPGRKSATPKSKPPLSKQAGITKDTPIDMSSDEAEDGEEDSDDDSVVEIPKETKKRKYYEKGLAPNYWVEVLSTITNTWLSCSPFFATDPVATSPDLLARFEPRGVKADKAKQVFCYVIAYSSDGTAKDVTVRYLKRHMFPGKTKGVRMMPEKVPVYDKHGRVKRYEHYDWFKSVMSGYERPQFNRTPADDIEDSTDLKPVKPEQKEKKPGEETLQDYKSSKEFVLERHLRREEALLPTAKPVKKFLVKGKKGEEGVQEDVYLRKDVVHCKSVETWHKEGRRPKLGEQPRKRVPFRAATINRKRELAEAEIASGGQKMLQGLYSHDQTEWIIPDPIVDGRIPKNGYGNMDVYVESMVPKGATHLRLKGAKRICNKLGIDFAEAVTGFEFGARMAIPVIEGVVVAEENADLVRNAWQEYEQERVRKEDEKRRKAAIGMWRKMMMGLRIIKRIQEEYPEDASKDHNVLSSWGVKGGGNAGPDEDDAMQEAIDAHDEQMAGGFFPEGHDEEAVPQGTFFPTRHDTDAEGGGGFIIEEAEKEAAPQTFFPTRHDSDDEDAGGGFIVEETPASAARASVSATPTFSSLSMRAAVAQKDEGDVDMDEDSADALAQKPPPAKADAKPTQVARKTPAKPRAKAAVTPRASATKVRPRIIDTDEDEDIEMADASPPSPNQASTSEDEDEGEEKPLTKPPFKRGRGRPKKAEVPRESLSPKSLSPKSLSPKQAPQPDSDHDHEEKPLANPLAKRGTGRPKKAEAPQETPDDDGNGQDQQKIETQPPAKRGRGRPKKAEIAKESPATRQTPKRRATRKSTGTKSAYFVESEEDFE